MNKIFILLFLFLSFNLFSYESQTEIDNLQLNKVLLLVLNKAYPGCKYDVEKNHEIKLSNIINKNGTQECNPSSDKIDSEFIKFKGSLSKRLQEKQQYELSKDIIRIFDCETLEGINKHMCFLLKYKK